MIPFLLLLSLLLLIGVILLTVRPLPPKELYAVFSTEEDPQNFEQQLRDGVALAEKIGAVPVLLLRREHPTELDRILELFAKERFLAVLDPELFPDLS